MTMDLDLLVDQAAVSAEIAAGVSLPFVVARAASDGAGLPALLWQTAPRKAHAPYWSAEDERFLRDHLGLLSEAEIAEQLGRTITAVHLRWKRDLALLPPSKAPTLMTCEQIGVGIRKDGHEVAKLIDRGILPGRPLPFEGRVMRVVDRVTLLRFLVNPLNWCYFDPRRVGKGGYGYQRRRGAACYDHAFWAKARRLVLRAFEAWDDEWWRIGKVAAYWGVGHQSINQRIARGQMPATDWGNWWVLKSVALAHPIVPGKGNPGCPKVALSDDAHAFILLARAVGYSCETIGRLMHVDGETVRHRIHRLQRLGEIPKILRRERLAITYTGASDGLYADWQRYRDRFPWIARRVTALEAKEHRTTTEGIELARYRRHAERAPIARSQARRA